MRFTAKRLFAAGAIGISALVTPIALTVALPGAGNVLSPLAGASGSAEILYNQTPAGADSFVFQDASGTQSPPQTANVSGNCAGATPAGPTILSMCGALYGALSYTGTPSAAILGTNGAATGVGAVSPSWTIDNKSNKGAEAIDFSPGNDTAVLGTGSSAFTDAQIPVQRKDTGVAQHPTVTVELAEFSSTPLVVSPTPPPTLLGIQDCTINGPQGTQITADPATCSVVFPKGGAAPATFGTIEVRDTTPSSSISVVGELASTAGPDPAVFELQQQVCGGGSVQAGDPNGTGVVATLYMSGPSTQCKTYTSFMSTGGANGGPPTLGFTGFSSTDVTFTVQITWPAVDLCSPYADSPPSGTFPGGTPTVTVPGASTGVTDSPSTASPPYAGVVGGQPGDMCPVHSFSFDGSMFYDQGYCQSAQPLPAPPTQPTQGQAQQALCTVAKSYNNDTVVDTYDPPPPNGDGKLKSITTTPITTSDNKPGTQIVETWVGNTDNYWH